MFIKYNITNQLQQFLLHTKAVRSDITDPTASMQETYLKH